MQKSRKVEFKEAEIGSKGHFPALYVIIKVSPPPPWNCPLHTIPPYFQNFILLLNPPPPFLDACYLPV